MEPKPAQFAPEFAAAFEDAAVARAYRHRPPYPPALFDLLERLLADEPRRVLDAGCGDGALARPLAPRVDRLDALDPSAAMLEAGRSLPGGDHPALRWRIGRAEDALLDPPYGLITAGQSLHWMTWEVALPRFADLLTAGGQLVIVNEEWPALPWHDDLLAIVRRYSLARDYRSVDLVAELEQRRLFERTGERRIEGVAFRQPLDDYIESFHARASLTRARMTAAGAAAFDDAVRALVSAHTGDVVEIVAGCTATWGRPRRP